VELRDFLEMHRAYNLVRKESDAESRLTFEEFSILCRLGLLDEPVRTSDIAIHQNALRPTMTHRTNRLAKLGLIDRAGSTEDKRIIICSISEEGEAFVKKTIGALHRHFHEDEALYRASSIRIRRVINAMGTLFCMAGDLVLLALNLEPNFAATVTRLVEITGFLQPTVSMAAASLVENELIWRDYAATKRSRSSKLVLTRKGKMRANRLQRKVEALVVKRKVTLETQATRQLDEQEEDLLDEELFDEKEWAAFLAQYSPEPALDEDQDPSMDRVFPEDYLREQVRREVAEEDSLIGGPGWEVPAHPDNDAEEDLIGGPGWAETRRAETPADAGDPGVEPAQEQE